MTRIRSRLALAAAVGALAAIGGWKSPEPPEGPWGRSRLAGATNRFFTAVGSMHCSSGTSCMITWYIEVSSPRFSMPNPVEALPWGSRSTTSVR